MVQISFNYSKVTATYFEQNQEGRNTRAKSVSYDVKLGKAEGN
jgi:type VI protein secretion system component Hcp